jgi:dipeptidyl-peptidase 4
MKTRNAFLVWLPVAALFLLLPAFLVGQDRLQKMPGYEQYQKMSKAIPGSVKLAPTQVTWKDEGKSVEYAVDGKLYRYDIAAGKVEEIGKGPADKGGQQKKGGKGKKADSPDAKVGRGLFATSALSPDRQRKAFYRAGNLWLSDAEGGNEVQVTTEGDEKKRIRYGTGSWVYSEELFQQTAMWWSPDGKKIAYYRFDTSKVPDYFLTLNQAKLQSTLDTESYPHAGVANPIVDIFVYDLESKKIIQADVRKGKPPEDAVVGYYVYQVSWSSDGKDLLCNRTNRLQNIMEFSACDPATGECRTIVKEEWPASWVENKPPRRFLKDNQRFIWLSERTGFKNFYLYDLTGKLQATLSKHPFDVASIVRVDEDAGLVYYLAHGGDNHMKMQLYRVGLDGQGSVCLTNPAFNHTVNLAPDGKHFIDVIQTHDMPPVTRLMDANGQLVAQLAVSDTSRFEKLGLKNVELFQFLAGDGKTPLNGMLHFPSNFDAKKKYPLLVTVYAGPETNKATETFTLPSAMTEYGFLVAALDSRSAAGRGKKFIDAIYQKLGITEIDDQAAGVKALTNRPYVDKNRVGIFGTSYGGYASILCLLRYPDVFQAASASSSVTDYRYYDSIYTERFMGLPQDNKAGYDAGSALLLGPNLKGRLMLYYGTADNNVHPSNTLALIKVLQKAGKSFEVQVGPDQGHTAVSQPRMMEFFIENLVLRK